MSKAKYLLIGFIALAAFMGCSSEKQLTGPNNEPDSNIQLDPEGNVKGIVYHNGNNPQNGADVALEEWVIEPELPEGGYWWEIERVTTPTGFPGDPDKLDGSYYISHSLPDGTKVRVSAYYYDDFVHTYSWKWYNSDTYTKYLWLP